MADVPDDLHYTAEHEYLKPAGEDHVFIVGITDYAQGELGDIVYVELPEPGATYGKMDVFGTVEAVKAVSDLYSPISGEVLEINDALADDPAAINSDPYGAGWMIKLRATEPSELDGLMDAAAYNDHIG